MATRWEIGNDLRFLCDKLGELERECEESINLSSDVLKVCRLAIGELSNKMCDDGVLVESNKACMIEVAEITARVKL